MIFYEAGEVYDTISEKSRDSISVCWFPIQFFFYSAFHNNCHKIALQGTMLQPSKPGKDDDGE